MCAEMGRKIVKNDGRGDGSKTYPALYINQCSITPVSPCKSPCQRRESASALVLFNCHFQRVFGISRVL